MQNVRYGVSTAKSYSKMSTHTIGIQIDEMLIYPSVSKTGNADLSVSFKNTKRKIV